eukprot:Selendium_serpulae@DN10168_c0_g1_i1.p1
MERLAGYASPNEKTDIFSAGLTLTELLSGNVFINSVPSPKDKTINTLCKERFMQMKHFYKDLKVQQWFSEQELETMVEKGDDDVLTSLHDEMKDLKQTDHEGCWERIENGNHILSSSDETAPFRQL